MKRDHSSHCRGPDRVRARARRVWRPAATSVKDGDGGLAPRKTLGARYVMGVDGGATKTLAAVLDLQEQTLHLGHGGSSNPTRSARMRRQTRW